VKSASASAQPPVRVAGALPNENYAATLRFSSHASSHCEAGASPRRLRQTELRMRPIIRQPNYMRLIASNAIPAPFTGECDWDHCATSDALTHRSPFAYLTLRAWWFPRHLLQPNRFPYEFQ